MWRTCYTALIGAFTVLVGFDAAKADCTNPDSFTDDNAQALFFNPEHTESPACRFEGSDSLLRNVDVDWNPDTPKELVAFNVGWDENQGKWLFIDESIRNRSNKAYNTDWDDTCEQRLDPANPLDYPRRKPPECKGLDYADKPVMGCQYKFQYLRDKIDRGKVWVDVFEDGQYGNPNAIIDQHDLKCWVPAERQIIADWFSGDAEKRLCFRGNRYPLPPTPPPPPYPPIDGCPPSE